MAAGHDVACSLWGVIISAQLADLDARQHRFKMQDIERDRNWEDDGEEVMAYLLPQGSGVPTP